MSHYRPHMMPKVRSKKIMSSAKGKPCTIRIASMIPGHACSSDETVNLCHLDKAGGKGMSTKVSHMAGVYGCQHCDDITSGVDGKRLQFIQEKYPAVLGQRIYSALVETHALMIEEGIIVIPDGEIIR